MPQVPPRLLSYQHPEGELHITSIDSSGNSANMVACPGQENSVRHFSFWVSPTLCFCVLTRVTVATLQHCSEGNSLLDTSVNNHLGPYFDDISFGGAACPA